jgi:hypothetical protein
MVAPTVLIVIFKLIPIGEGSPLPIFLGLSKAFRLFGAMSPLAPSERGLPRKRVEEPAKQKAVRLF